MKKTASLSPDFKVGRKTTGIGGCRRDLAAPGLPGRTGCESLEPEHSSRGTMKYKQFIIH
jgi:hypothetical protein